MAKEDKIIYDPENIEYLLLNKEFNELREKEKEYVLKFISGPAEYAQMRQALLATYKTKPAEDELLRPRKHVKDELLQQFRQQHEQERMPWLNVLILPFRNLEPQVRIALGGLAAAIVLVSGLLIFSDSPKSPVAVNGGKETPSGEKTSQNPPVFTDNLENGEKEKAPTGSTTNTGTAIRPGQEKSSQTAEAGVSKNLQKPASSAKQDSQQMAEADMQKQPRAGAAPTANAKAADADKISSSNLAEDEELIDLLFTAM